MENLNENKVEYVLYEAEKGNEYIESISRLSNAVRKIIRTKTGAVMEEFYDFSKYKNVRTLAELSKALEENEYLAIVLDERTRDLVNPNNIIEYVDHELKKTERKVTVREIGDKLYIRR